MDEKPPFDSNRSNKFTSRSLFHLGVMLAVAAALWLSGLDPFPSSPPRPELSPPPVATALPSAVASAAVSAPPTIVAPQPARDVDRQLGMPPSGQAVQPPVEDLMQPPAPGVDILESVPEGAPEGAEESASTPPPPTGNDLSDEDETSALDSSALDASAHDLPSEGERVSQPESEDLSHGEFGQALEVIGEVQPFYSPLVGPETEVRPFDSPLVQPESEVYVSSTAGDWMWPMRGYISQAYSDAHRALDISGEHGDVVLAADAGVVIYAKWESTGFGYLVIVDHGNGYVSYYAHLYGFYVDVGQALKRGQPIGALGETGLSSGPHLHFEIRHNGVQRNPLDLLPSN